MSRQHARDNLYRVERLKDSHKYLKEDLARVIGDGAFEKSLQYYDVVCTKLSDEMYAMPVGFRHTGKFYTRKQYTVPTEYDEHEGSVFLREDLVSWLIDGDDSHTYYRTVFKSIEPEVQITKENSEPVYAEPAG
jgi:phosphoglucomutase